MGGEANYTRAFDWRNYEYTKKPLVEFSNTESCFQAFKAWMEGIAEKHGKTAIIPAWSQQAITGSHWGNSC